jgi:rRNA processing protein Krr1/Pno1
MSNTIVLNPKGYIEVTIAGDQTYDTFHRMISEVIPHIQQLKAQKKPVLGLVDLTQEGKITQDSNKGAMEVLEKTEYDRVALFGAPSVLKEVVHLIILAMGKKESTQLFSDRESAIAWLLG